MQQTATHCNTLQYTVTYCDLHVRGRQFVTYQYPHYITRTAAHCNTRNILQHACMQTPSCDIAVSALHHTHCNTLQHTATHCNTLQHTATYCNTHVRGRQVVTFQYPHYTTRTVTHCNALQHTATYCNAHVHGRQLVTSQYPHYVTQTATHCNTLQHPATHYNTPPYQVDEKAKFHAVI